jgi:hypothetical protein
LEISLRLLPFRASLTHQDDSEVDIMEFNVGYTEIETFEIQVTWFGEVIYEVDGFRTQEQVVAWIDHQSAQTDA